MRHLLGILGRNPRSKINYLLSEPLIYLVLHSIHAIFVSLIVNWIITIKYKFIMENLNLSKGQIVLLDLDDECVIGEIVHIGSKRSFVRLRNVRDFQTNLPIVGTQDYYYSEIKHVKIVESESADGPDNESAAGTSELSSAAAASVTRINLEEVQDIFNRIESHIFIHQTDTKYHDAIKYLKTQKLIALSMEGIDLGRHSGTPSLLSVATSERIYIFDVKWMNVTSDMKAILVSPKVRRVIHNGRRFQDALKHQCGASLGKYFDTLVSTFVGIIIRLLNT